MSEDDAGGENFEELMRSIAREVGRSLERVVQVDVDEIAERIGVDPERARQWADTAGRWLRAQAEGIGDEVHFGSSGAADTARKPDAPRRAGPHPLDLPTEEQGVALAALDSGRWTVEPGSNVLDVHGEGPGPSDPLGLVGELRARDWIAADGQVTLVGRQALGRWLAAAG